MTIRAASFTSRPFWLAAALAGLVAAVVLVLAAATSNQAAASATLTCDTIAVGYGDAVTCTVTSDDDVILEWGDGTTSIGAGSFTHTIGAVGPITVIVTDDAGTPLAKHPVDVTPDVAIDCDFGLPLPVYELAPSIDGGAQPYDYVYVTDTGSKLFPGDDAYPSNLGEMLAAERAVVEEAPIVGLCRSVSNAVDDLGGSVEWTVESPWYEAYVTKSRNITPGTPAHWDGVQPIDVTIRIDVDGYEASERIGVYFGGCG